MYHIHMCNLDNKDTYKHMEKVPIYVTVKVVTSRKNIVFA